MSAAKEELLRRLEGLGQQHLLAFWDELEPASRARLVEEIESIDLERMARLVGGDDASPDWAALAARALPPRAIRLEGGGNEFSASQARTPGKAALGNGKVGAILVAGGQGTRLGFPHPKGLLPLGPVSGRTLFQILIDRLLAIGERHGTRIPLYVMTSPTTHRETVEFLASHRCFGLPSDDLRCFCQGVMPTVDAATGRILLASRDSVSLGPDGHGGMLAALADSGCLADAENRGLQHLFYGQIDNPLLQLCDPLLIGYHLLAESEMTTQVVAKRDPLDRVGNVAIIDGRSQIIEYSDLPETAARRRNPDGSLYFWAGSIAVHVFEVSFLARMTGRRDELPFHRARKKIPYVDADGRHVQPQQPNAIKFERFIFDLLPAARNPIVVESAAADAFAPVKNAAGEVTETVATAQAAMVQRDAALLRAAGIDVSPGVAVEINPRWALDVQEIRSKLAPGTRIATPTYFCDE